MGLLAVFVTVSGHVGVTVAVSVIVLRTLWCTQVDPIDVIWHCSKCTPYAKECARPPQQLDALSSL